MYAVLMYEYLDGDSPLVGVRKFASEERAEVFASWVCGVEVPYQDRGAVVSLACVWECDAQGNLVRATGNEWEG